MAWPQEGASDLRPRHWLPAVAGVLMALFLVSGANLRPGFILRRA